MKGKRKSGTEGSRETDKQQGDPKSRMCAQTPASTPSPDLDRIICDVDQRKESRKLSLRAKTIMSHEILGMSRVKYPTKSFGQVISRVDNTW